MNEQIGPPFEVKNCRGGSNVTLRKPVCSNAPVKAGNQQVMSDIELSVFVQKGSFDILLDDKCSQTTVTIFLLAFQPEFDVI